MALPTVREVSVLLVEYGFCTNTFTGRSVKLGTVRNVADETYGPKSFLYIYCSDLEKRSALERFLESKGVSVSKEYALGQPIIELQVRYFRGTRWDE